MAADRAHHRERDAGVAAGRVEDDRTLAETPLLLGGDDHPQRRAVLDAAPGIGRFDLRPQLAAQAGADPAQRHERRVTDALQDRAAHAFAHEGGGEGHAEERLGAVDRLFDEVITRDARIRSIAQLRSMDGLDLDKPAVMDKAWR